MADRENGNGKSSRTTIRDIAARAGVSVATVSRTLNGRPDVAPATRELILGYVREEGYSTNRNARGLAGGRTGLIGFSLPYVHSSYFGELAAGAAEACSEHDERLVLCLTAHQHDREVSLLERLMHGTTDGALIVLPAESNQELMALRQQGYPFVVIDPKLPSVEGLPIVAAAHWSGARAATEHLTHLGHRRIAAITGVPNWVATIDRLAGYQSALVSAGLPLVPQYVVRSDWTIEDGEASADQLLDLPDPPTAIFAFNDNMAIGALRAAHRRGLSVPNDLSVVGVDDTEIASAHTPALTTVRQPLAEMGRVAVGLLRRLIDGQPVDAARIELSTRLIVRESTAPPRTEARKTA